MKRKTVEEPIIFYDFTRLLNRRYSLVATGIDRVDIRFAKATFREFGDNCFPITKVGKRAFLFDTALALVLIESLEKVWFNGEECDMKLAFSMEYKGLTERVLGPFFQHIEKEKPNKFSRMVYSLLNQVIRQGLYLKRNLGNYFKQDAEADISRLASKGEPLIYINCSALGLPKQKGLLGKLSAKCNLRSIAYIYDIIPIEYPEYTSNRQKGKFQEYLSELNSVNTKFIALSKHSAKRLQNYAKDMHWQVGEVPVIYPDVEPFNERVDRTQQKQGVSQKKSTPYFIVIGTIEPRKNHLLLLHIWRDFVESGIEPVPHLHIVGTRGWENENIIDMLDRCEAIRPYVTEHNNLTDGELKTLLQGARALLFPSFEEGFGLPLVEALQLNVPVIASNLEVFREIAGNTPVYLSPIDGIGWQQHILDAAKNPKTSSLPVDNKYGNTSKWSLQAEPFISHIRKVSEK